MARELTRRRRPERDADAYTAPAEEATTPEEAPAARRGSRRGTTAEVHTDEQEKPARGRRAEPEEAEKPTVAKGWGSYKKVAEETKGDYAGEFKPEDDGTETLVKILDDAPFAVYKQHWIERGKGKKKSFNCLGAKGNGCPLCDDLGNKPSLQAMFNVVDMLDEEPKPLIWKVGKMISDILENHSTNERTAPLSRSDLYFSVKKTVTGSGSGKKTAYLISAVKERDLTDDWDVDPLTEQEFDDLYAEGYDDTEVRFETRAELKEIVDEVLKD